MKEPQLSSQIYEYAAALRPLPARVETAVKLGEMEKDKMISIQSHFDLMSATFRKLAEPI